MSVGIGGIVTGESQTRAIADVIPRTRKKLISTKNDCDTTLHVNVKAVWGCTIWITRRQRDRSKVVCRSEFICWTCQLIIAPSKIALYGFRAPSKMRTTRPPVWPQTAKKKGGPKSVDAQDGEERREE